MGKVSSLRHLDKEAGTPKTHSKPLKAVILLLGFYLAELTEKSPRRAFGRVAGIFMFCVDKRGASRVAENEVPACLRVSPGR